MSTFPLNDTIPCEKNYSQNGKYVKNSSSNIKKLLQVVQNENSMEETIEKVFNKKPTGDASFSIDYVDVQVAEDLKEEKRQRFLEQKRRQQLRENTEELKELEMKLRAAYISKGLAAQRAERELLQAKEKEKQNQENEVLEKARINYEENEKRKEELDRQKKEKLMTELKGQIKFHESQKTLKIEQFVEEKRTVDQIVQKIREEQYEEQRVKVQKRTKMKEDAEDFFRARQILKAENDAIDNEQDKSIESLKKEWDERAKNEKEEKSAKLKQRQQISETIGKKLNMEMKDKYKRMDVLEDLLIEEKEAHDDEVERKECAKQIKKQEEHRVGLFALIENNKRREKEQAEEDRQYFNLLLEELAKNDELEKLKEQQKKQKMYKHKQSIQDDLDNKIQLRAKELTELLNQRESDVRESQRKQQLIEEERIKMLQEHAAALQGFFPPGILRETDREFLSMQQREDLK